MKWQRARVLPDRGTHPDFPKPGTLIWVQSKRPTRRCGIFADGLLYEATAYESTVKHPDGRLFLVNASHVELLAEFSDAENPDEESCQ